MKKKGKDKQRKEKGKGKARIKREKKLAQKSGRRMESLAVEWKGGVDLGWIWMLLI
jgi:hypothetical protein